MRPPIRLGEASASLRWVITLALMTLGAGYLVALINLHFTYSMMDGRPGTTAEDLRRAFHGNRTVTRLAAKIDGGSMEQFLPDELDKAKILNWIQDGAPKEAFFSQIAPILAENCWRCHNPDGFMHMRPLQTYEQVSEVNRVDRGEPAPVWARVAHTHLQSIALIFVVVGGVFSFSKWPERWKAPLVIAPFVALLVDFGCRYLARYHDAFIYGVLIAGGAAALCFAIMVLASLWELWIESESG